MESDLLSLSEYRAYFLELHRLARELQYRADNRKLDYVHWLPGQWEFLNCDDPIKLLRTGNQYGKSFAAAAEIIWRCLGTHPFLETREPPITVWIISDSLEASKPIQKHLWNLIPHDQLDPSVEYVEPRGFRGIHPIIKFKNGSLISIKTTNQGALSAASATIDYVHIDEPTTPEIFSECRKRLQARGGKMGIGVTPLHRDCDWLIELTKETEITNADGSKTVYPPLVSDLHFRATVENYTPIGKTEPISIDDGMGGKRLCDQAWIDEIYRNENTDLADIKVHGEWDRKLVGSFFEKSWIGLPQEKGGHIYTSFPGIDKAHIKLGIDFGSGAKGSSVAILCGIDYQVEIINGRKFKTPKIYVMDEYVSNGSTTTKQDADSILVMLHRNNIDWQKDLDQVWADRAYMPNDDILRKSLTELETEIAFKLGIKKQKLNVRIQNAKMGPRHGKGSLALRQNYLHRSLLAKDLLISAQCNTLIECFNKFDGHDKSQFKHCIDALSYALDYETFSQFNKTRRIRMES